MPTGRAVLLSIYPRYARKIISGEKRLEFRKAWPSSGVTSFVIYSTAPVQRIVGIARVKKVHRDSPTGLWKLAQQIGGGVTRSALREYLKDRSEGCAVEIASVRPLSVPIDPYELIPNFTAPQSFNYLDEGIFDKIKSAAKTARPKGKIIFVAGVHGVGKTSLCQAAARSGSVIHKSASELIREQRASAISADTKAVSDVAGNQKLLADAVRRVSQAGKPLLLDGHFALLNKNSRPEALPANVFAELGIDAVILVHDRASKIAARLGERDGSGISTKEIATLQAVETSQALKVCQELGLPLRRIKAFGNAAFDDVLSALICA